MTPLQMIMVGMSILFLIISVLVFRIFFLRESTNNKLKGKVVKIIREELEKYYPTHDLDYIFQTMRGDEADNLQRLDKVVDRAESLRPAKLREVNIDLISRDIHSLKAKIEIVYDRIGLLDKYYEELRQNSITIGKLLWFVLSIFIGMVGLVGATFTILQVVGFL